jgi:hypothetical protein
MQPDIHLCSEHDHTPGLGRDKTAQNKAQASNARNLFLGISGFAGGVLEQ